MKLQFALLFLLIQCLVACSEGGTGGTGLTDVTTPEPTMVVIGGQGNKGPMAEGASVLIERLSSTGEVLSNTSSTTSSSGHYESNVEEDSINLITIDGRYFSENKGEIVDETIAISAVHASADNRTAHVNLLTHLIHERVLKLMTEGNSVIDSLSQAENEFFAALADLLTVPPVSFRFTDLVVINAFADSPVASGNGYLLALTSILEQHAIKIAEENGSTATQAMTFLIEDLAGDLADDGELATDLSGLQSAQREINPNRIHQNLFEFDPTFIDQVIAELAVEPPQDPKDLKCRVNLDSFECFPATEINLSSSNAIGTVPLGFIVGDMNEFVDTDQDGLVNLEDEDDDSDGILDVVDTQPYRQAVLIRGYANKGPMVEGASVLIEMLNDTGDVLFTTTSTTSSSGQYESKVEEDSTNRITVAGRYFSENRGELINETIRITAIYSSVDDQPAHVNLLTHLTHKRVLKLMAEGTNVTDSITQAENELIASFEDLLTPPTEPFHFTDLVVINSFADRPNESGNGYLLALTSILEQYAINEANMTGSSETEVLAEYLNLLAEDLADDGDLAVDIAALNLIQRDINPNTIHQNLFEFDETFMDQVIAELGIDLPTVPGELRCRVHLDSFECFPASESFPSSANAVGTRPLSSVIANMNGFVDTDLDGLVNLLDEDDDSDGFADIIDLQPFRTSIVIGGHANKGPLEQGANVSATRLSTSGQVLSTARSLTTFAGRYEVMVEEDSINLITAEGHYFSELNGVFTGENITISAIHSSAAGGSAHVNLLTHLIHERVLKLMSEGYSGDESLTQAESELITALAGVLNPPPGLFRFTDLVVINTFTEHPIEAGNSYLLALTSMLEQYAIALAEEDGSSVTVTLGEILKGLTEDLAEDGNLSEHLIALQSAQGKIDLNRIHQNLFEFDASFKDQVVEQLQVEQPLDPGEVQCHVHLDAFECFASTETDLASSRALGSVPLNSIIPDMNQFIDTDLDGFVNRQDDDDDSDGIRDVIDSHPFNPSLLVPAEASQDFVNYMKRGLRQWSGVEPNSPVLALGQNPFGSTVVARSTDDVTPPPGGVQFSSPQPGSPPGTPFTQTNLIVEGVDEIDPVKYDGEYLFVANYDSIQVLRTPADLQQSEVLDNYTIGTADEDGKTIRGIYLTDSSGMGRMLAAVWDDRQQFWYPNFFAPSYLSYSSKTWIQILDANDVTNLTESQMFELDGGYINSRRVGDVLYVITRFTPDLPDLITPPITSQDIEDNKQLINETDVGSLLPGVVDQTGESSSLVTAENCLIPPLSTDSDDAFYPTLTTITAIDLIHPEAMTSVCVADGIQGLYVSPDAIYLAALDRGLDAPFSYPQDSLIHKFSIKENVPEYRGTGRVPGTFWGDPEFLMGEHEGNLTAITTTRASLDDGLSSFDHHLTILGESGGDDFKLVKIGQIPNDNRPEAIGKPNEQVYASRIVGERAYVVTFVKVDPVYTIDLSDPTDPAIIGELEIPGYSSYLHPISDSLLLGVGKDAVDYNGATYFQGVNVRLFDVGEPGSINLTSSFSIGSRGTESPVLTDLHAFTILADEVSGTQRIAIPVSVHGTADNPPFPPYIDQPWTHDALYLFEVNEAVRTLTFAGIVIGENLDTGRQFAPNCCNWSDRSFLNGEMIHFLSQNNLITALWSRPLVSERTFIPTIFADTDALACTPDNISGLNVKVFDRETRNDICPQITVRDETTVVDLSNCNVLARVYRPGEYQVTVSNVGYTTWTGENIVVQSDECYVHETGLEVYLAPQ